MTIPQSGSVPPALPPSLPPVIAPPPPLVPGSPPPLAPNAPRTSDPARRLLAGLLSLCLALFLADAVVSLADDSLILFFDVHFLAGLRGVVFLFSLLLALAVYGLMGLTPMIPKRLFLPLTLFNLAVALLAIPSLIYFYHRLHQLAWVFSCSQLLFALGFLCLVQRGFKLRWPLVPAERLGTRQFNWLNLLLFVLANLFVLLPAVIAYFVLCAALAVHHFSDGFVALRPAGFTVQARKYVRADGKTIQLLPLVHIGAPAFYRNLAESVPTNSVILMEGVTDRLNLLTNKITYKRMATSLGLAEQQQEFHPRHAKLVPADVDVEQFDPSTITLLNLVMLIHAKGVTAENVLKLTQYSPPPALEKQLLDDLLGKRNRRLIEELQAQLPESEHIIVPWGAAHMPGIAKEVQKAGFRLHETQDYLAIPFAPGRNQSRGVGDPNRNPTAPLPSTVQRRP
jgi:hypothetical protein